MSTAKSPLELAAEIYKIDPRRFGEPHILRFELAQVAAGQTGQPITISTPRELLICGISAQPNDGAAASYSGLELELLIGETSLASDGKTSQFVPFSFLAGRGPGPSQAGGPWYVYRVPLLIGGTVPIVARVKNRTAGALTPAVAIDTVLLQP